MILNKTFVWALFLGFISGFPLAFTGGTLSAMLVDRGLDIKTLGLFSLVGLPYVWKFLWAPLLDKYSIPLFKGRRKGWLILLQLLLLFTLNALPFVVASYEVEYVAILTLIIAFLSASQDVVIDAFRIENITATEQPQGAAAVQIGYRAAMLLTGGGALILADQFGWQYTVCMLTITMLPVMLMVFFTKEQNNTYIETTSLKDAFILPASDFMASKKNWLVILLFVVLFKMPDALAVALQTKFYMDLGFSKTDIGSIVKIYGVIATIVGTTIGGIIAPRLGLRQALLYAIIVQAVSNLSYIWLHNIGYDMHALMVVVSVDNTAGGFGSTLFVTYLSLLCAKQFTATQYALLSALASFARVQISAFSGFMVAGMGWDYYFLFTVILAVPAMLLLKKATHSVVMK